METNKEKLQLLGIDFLNERGNQVALICPKCSHDRKSKGKKPLSVNIEDGTYNCHHCSWQGRVQKTNTVEEKIYFKPTFNNRTDLPKSVVDYFFKRGISQDTLLKMKITAGMEYMPQENKEVNTLQFNYFKNKELANVKYRDGKKNFKLVKNAELIFYNIDAIEKSDWCIITEGEIDALSWIECGIDEVVSVPNGASKGSQRLEYLDNCYSYFLNKSKIYIATDNDDAGKSLRDELGRRLGFERCFWIDFKDQKDSNECLSLKGNKQDLLSLLDSAKEFSIEGVFTIDDVWSDLEYIYNNGMPTGSKTGDQQFDEHLGIMPGELTMVTGIPGHGKSIYLDQISLRLCLKEQWTFGICSPESYPTAAYYSRLIKRLVGKKFSKNHISEELLLECRGWLKNKYHLIAPPSGYDLEEILERARLLVLKKGIKGLIIDPWNRIESKMPNGYNPIKWVQERLDMIIRFNQKNGVHTFLVAHPTKMGKDKDGNYLVPNLYSISGSGDFFNMTQNGFTVYKDEVSKKTQIHFQKVKWEHLGKTGMIEYSYYEPNARFYVQGKENPERNWLTQPDDLFDPVLENLTILDSGIDLDDDDNYPF